MSLSTELVEEQKLRHPELAEGLKLLIFELMNPKVDTFLAEQDTWKEELTALRNIVFSCGLKEELKWGVPTYMAHNKNAVMLGGFKDHCVLSFIKGVLLSDSAKILESPGANSQSVRVVRFRSLREIQDKEAILKAYIFEAVEIEKSGLKVEKKAIEDMVIIEELQNKLDADPLFKSAFEALTPGRRRAYNMYFSSAKQAKSRLDRIEKYTPRILKGKGMNDCVCGHSKRMPNCDGSHKLYE